MCMSDQIILEHFHIRWTPIFLRVDAPVYNQHLVSFKLLAEFFLQQMMGWWWDASCLLSWYTWSNEKHPGKVETKQQEWAKSWISRRSFTLKSCQGCILKCCNANQKDWHIETRRSVPIKTHYREIIRRQGSALSHFLLPPSLLLRCFKVMSSLATNKRGPWIMFGAFSSLFVPLWCPFWPKQMNANTLCDFW